MIFTYDVFKGTGTRVEPPIIRIATRIVISETLPENVTEVYLAARQRTDVLWLPLK